MRILQVTPYFLPHQGGVERYVLRLSRDLVLEGNKVTIYTSIDRSIPHKTKLHEWSNGFEIYRFETFASPLGNPITPRLFVKLLKNANSYDLINCHDEHFTSIITLLFKKIGLIKVPVVLHCHGLMPFTSGLSYFIGRIYDLTLQAMAFKNASSVVALTSFDKNYIIKSSKIDPEKVRVIPNAISIENYNLKVDPTLFVEKFGLESNKVILYVGALSKRKGVQYLIDSASQIINAVANVKFVIVGSGKNKNALEMRVKERGLNDYFIFTGWISDEELFMAYKSCDLVVLPSLVEGLPTTIYEALLYSKPIVASNLPGIYEFFRGSVELFPPKDVKTLTHAIIRVLKNRDYANSLVSNGKELLDRLNWKATFPKICSLYNDVMNQYGYTRGF